MQATLSSYKLRCTEGRECYLIDNIFTIDVSASRVNWPVRLFSYPQAFNCSFDSHSLSVSSKESAISKFCSQNIK